jgi:hypothetical protein
MPTLAPYSGSVCVAYNTQETTDREQAASVSIDGWMTRQQAADRVGTTPRNLSRWLELLMVHSENFFEFEHPVTGGVNGRVKIAEHHIPELLDIKERFARTHSTELVRLELRAKHSQTQEY